MIDSNHIVNEVLLKDARRISRRIHQYEAEGNEISDEHEALWEEATLEEQNENGKEAVFKMAKLAKELGVLENF